MNISPLIIIIEFFTLLSYIKTIFAGYFIPIYDIFGLEEMRITI